MARRSWSEPPPAITTMRLWSGWNRLAHVGDVLPSFLLKSASWALAARAPPLKTTPQSQDNERCPMTAQTSNSQTLKFALHAVRHTLYTAPAARPFP